MDERSVALGVTRSTRAGTRVPATGRARGRRVPDRARSTRAGTRVPATVAAALLVGATETDAQRGPGLASRQRAWECRTCALTEIAQRGPGLASRQRRRSPWLPQVQAPERSTRAGTRVPATGEPQGGEQAGDLLGRSTRAGTRVPATGSLVGPPRHLRRRSTRAGTRVPATGGVAGQIAWALRAQRGPGLASRQRLGDGGRLRDGRRSTRAGTRVPATGRRPYVSWKRTCFHAQRGPGLASRQRSRTSLSCPALLPRSTRAGTRVPATGGGGGRLRSRPGNRSTRAGTRVPATVCSGSVGFTTIFGAQRGPGLASRQRAVLLRDAALGRVRSTRAGTRVPATAWITTHGFTVIGVRSTRAGTRVPATDHIR